MISSGLTAHKEEKGELTAIVYLFKIIINECSYTTIFYHDYSSSKTRLINQMDLTKDHELLFKLLHKS